MATRKVIGKLLKFKGFKAVDLAFKRGEELHIAVKPFKNGFNVRGVGDAARP